MVLVSEGLLGNGQEQAVLLVANDEGELAALELMWMTSSPPEDFPAPYELQISPR